MVFEMVLWPAWPLLMLHIMYHVHVGVQSIVTGVGNIVLYLGVWTRQVEQ